MSVPPPPMIAFQAKYPGGNKTFISNVGKNLNTVALKPLNKDLKTKSSLKSEVTAVSSIFPLTEIMKFLTVRLKKRLKKRHKVLNGNLGKTTKAKK